MKHIVKWIVYKALALSMALTASGLFTFQAWAVDSAVKEVRGPIWISAPDTATTKLQSITVLAPANGYVTITATGTIVYEHTAGVAGGWYCLDLHNTANYTGGCIPMAGSDTAVRAYIPADFPTVMSNEGGISAHYSIVRTWPVVAGRRYAFYLNGYVYNIGQVYLFQPTMTAIFNPALLP